MSWKAHSAVTPLHIMRWKAHSAGTLTMLLHSRSMSPKAHAAVMCEPAPLPPDLPRPYPPRLPRRVQDRWTGATPVEDAAEEQERSRYMTAIEVRT